MKLSMINIVINIGGLFVFQYECYNVIRISYVLSYHVFLYKCFEMYVVWAIVILFRVQSAIASRGYQYGK